MIDNIATRFHSFNADDRIQSHNISILSTFKLPFIFSWSSSYRISNKNTDINPIDRPPIDRPPLRTLFSPHITEDAMFKKRKQKSEAAKPVAVDGALGSSDKVEGVKGETFVLL